MKTCPLKHGIEYITPEHQEGQGCVERTTLNCEANCMLYNADSNDCLIAEFLKVHSQPLYVVKGGIADDKD